eukprot:7852629-Ditylum_brightwellii.AAC.1
MCTLVQTSHLQKLNQSKISTLVQPARITRVSAPKKAQKHKPNHKVHVIPNDGTLPPPRIPGIFIPTPTGWQQKPVQ